MLLLDEKKINAKEFCEKFGIDLAQITKSPVYEVASKYKKKDKANGSVTKVPARISIPNKTFIKNKVTGDVHELRYAENKSTKMVKGEKIDTYTPRYSYLIAEKTSFKKDLDQAVYMFANVSNFSSPFGNGKNADYEHVNPTARALSKLNSLNDVGTAMNMVKDMKDIDIMVLAKGLAAEFKNFNPFVNGKDTDVQTVRVELLQFAQLNATVFLENVDNGISKVRGQVVNLVDKGIIKLTTTQNIRQWKWDAGDRKGQPLGDQIVDPHVNAMDVLLNFVLGNLSQYYDAIHTVHNTVSIEAGALDFLKKKKEESATEVKSEAHIGDLPKDYAECREWMADHGFRKLPGNVKKLEVAIQDGSVNAANIVSFARELDETN